MKIKTTFIDNILNNLTNIEQSNSELNEFGFPSESGSIEFEIMDKFGKIWGGRMIKSDDGFELVEFFPKLFFTDASSDKLLAEAQKYKGKIINQEFDEFIDFLD